MLRGYAHQFGEGSDATSAAWPRSCWCSRPPAPRLPPPPGCRTRRTTRVSVIDVGTLAVVATIAVGRRPRGLVFSPDIATLYVCASDSDAVQVLDVGDAQDRRRSALGRRSRVLRSRSGGALSLHRQRGRCARPPWSTRRTRRVVAQIDVGVEPEGMAISHDGRWAVTTSETTNMVHWIDTATTRGRRQHPGRPAAALRAVHRRRQAAVGDVRDRRGRRGDRRRQPHRWCTRSASPSRACRRDLIQPVGIRLSPRRQDGLRGAGAGQSRRGGRYHHLRGRRNTCWSAAASGSST